KDALSIFHLHRESNRIARGLLVAFLPLHADAALGVVQQVDHVGAARRVHGHALATTDVADDLLAPNGVAAARAVHEQIVHAIDLDAILAWAQHALDDGDHAVVWRLFLQLLGRHELREDGARRQPAVPDGCHHLVVFAAAVLLGELAK